MPILTPYQADFSAGELSPKLWGRIDIDQYWSGAAELVNFNVLPYGPIMRRTGSRFIAKARTNANVRLISFSYNIQQSVVIELTDSCARFYYEGGQILNDGAPYEIETPWTADMLSGLRYAQSGDILFIVHEKVKPTKLSRYGWTDWRIEEISFTSQPEEWTENNWPSQVCFFDQRLIFAATPKQSQTIWCSRVGIFTDFTKETTVTVGSETDTEVMDTDAIIYTLSSDDVNPIMWMQPMEILAIGTAGAEYKVAASALNEALTPNNFRITKQTNYGAAPVSSKGIGSGAIFVQRGSNRIRLYDYEYLENKWAAQNATVFSDHIAMSGVVDTAVQTSKDTYFWAVLNDGTLACFTYEKQQKVSAWHRHDIAGGLVKSITVIPGAESDQVWMAVERVINGETVVYVEAFIPPFDEVSDVKKARYLDSYKEYSGDPVSEVLGLEHLEGETVGVLIDGWVHPDVEVKDGKITLQVPGSEVCVGKRYTSRFVSLEIQSQQEVTVGRHKRVIEADVSLYRSLGLRAGAIDGTSTDFKNKTTDMVYFGPTRSMNAAVDLFTGVKKLDISAPMYDDTRLVLETDFPLPMMVRGIKYVMEIN